MFEQRGTHHIRAVFAVRWGVVPWVAAAGVLQQEGDSHRACRSRWVTVTSAATKSRAASVPSLTAKGVLSQGNSGQLPTAGHREMTPVSSSTSLALSMLPSGACPTALSPLSTHCLSPGWEVQHNSCCCELRHRHRILWCCEYSRYTFPPIRGLGFATHLLFPLPAWARGFLGACQPGRGHCLAGR